MATPMKFLLLAIFIATMYHITEARLTDYCLQCICEKTRDCRCDNNGNCGPFDIRSSYMNAASDSETGRMSFEQCSDDVGCSRRVFEAYVDSYVPRESSRRMSQCELASRISKGGALGPNSRAADGFWLAVQSCMIDE